MAFDRRTRAKECVDDRSVPSGQASGDFMGLLSWAGHSRTSGGMGFELQRCICDVQYAVSECVASSNSGSRVVRHWTFHAVPLAVLDGVLPAVRLQPRIHAGESGRRLVGFALAMLTARR